MKTTVALLLLFVAILLGGYFSESPTMLGKDNAPEATPQVNATQASTTDTVYTAAQVSAHGTESSCWTSINGNVYDLTDWISEHPGGEAAILSICGKDGTQAFQAQHGRSRDTEPKQILETFKIGTLAS